MEDRPPDHDPSPAIDRLLDRAVQAINRGDRARAHELAGQVLAVDAGNPDAEDLLSAPEGEGEIRRLTILFCDLVDSTVLSTQVGPETYRTVVGRYRDDVFRIVERYEGHIGSTKGDGILAVFGHPTAHENDVRRAVQAGLDITRVVARLGDRARQQFEIDVDVRVGVHRGMVYLDTTEDDVYGFAANLTARLQGLAEPGTVVVSDVVERLVVEDFDMEAQTPRAVKGVPEPVSHHVVIGERAEAVSRIRSPRPPLIGRHREIERLEARWAEALTSSLASPGVALRGEAGMGKTALALAMADRLEAAGGVVLELIGSPFHTDAGLHPVRALIERRCGLGRTADASERLRGLEREIGRCGLDPGVTIPLLAPVLGVAPESGYEPAPADGRKLHDQIANAVEQYLFACLGDGPGLVLVDDVQWLDDSTLSLVRDLLGADLGRFMVLMTVREGVAVPGGSRVEVLDLEPLTDDETEQLILALDPALPAPVRSAISQRCDGIPLYIEQVVAGIEGSTGSVGSEGSDSSTETEVPGVPEALYEPLFARLRASAGAVHVATAAATIGREVDRRLLVSVLHMTDEELGAALEELEEALVLEPMRDDLIWRFRHEMLREVAYELQPPSDRRSLHGRVADALVSGSADEIPDWRVVAGHFDRAARCEEASSAYEKAADDARRRGALVEARAHLTRAIDQVERSTPGPPHDRREVALRLRRGFLAVAAEGNSSPEAASDFERCLELCGPDVRGDEMFGTLVALWGYYASRADLNRALQVLESLKVRVEEDREFFRPENDAGFGMVAWFRGEFDSSRDMLERVTVEVQAVGSGKEVEAVWFLPNEPVASMHTHLALARFVHGDLDGTEAELRATARRVEILGFPQGPFSLAYARSIEIWMRSEAGQLDRAGALADDLAEQAERHGFDSWLLVASTQRAAVAALVSLRDASDSAAASEHAAMMANFVDTWRMLEVRAFLTFYYGVVGRLFTAAGQLDEARTRLDEALQLASDTGMSFYDAELLRLRAHTEPVPELRAHGFGDAVGLARKQGAVVFELRAALDDFDLRGPPARDTLLDAMSRFPADSTWPELQLARAKLH